MEETTIAPLNPEVSVGLEQLQAELDKLRNLVDYVDDIKQSSSQVIERADGFFTATRSVAQQGESLLDVGHRLLERVEGAGVIGKVEGLSKTMGDVSKTIEDARNDIRRCVSEVGASLAASAEIVNKAGVSVGTASQVSQDLAEVLERLHLEDTVTTLAQVEQRLQACDSTIKRFQDDVQSQADQAANSVTTAIKAREATLHKAEEVVASSRQLVEALERSITAVNASAESKRQSMDEMVQRLEQFSRTSVESAERAAATTVTAARLGDSVREAVDSLHAVDTVKAVREVQERARALGETISATNAWVQQVAETSNSCLQSGIRAIEEASANTQETFPALQRLVSEADRVREQIEEADIPGQIEGLRQSLPPLFADLEARIVKTQAGLDQRLQAVEKKLNGFEKRLQEELSRNFDFFGKRQTSARNLVATNILLSIVTLIILAFHVLR